MKFSLNESKVTLKEQNLLEKATIPWVILQLGDSSFADLFSSSFFKQQQPPSCKQLQEMYINIIGCLEWPALCRSCTASQMCSGQFCWLEHPKLFLLLFLDLLVCFGSLSAVLGLPWGSTEPQSSLHHASLRFKSVVPFLLHTWHKVHFFPQKSWSFVDSTSFLKCWGPHGSFIKKTWTQIWGKCKDFCRFCCKWWLLLTFLVQ